MEVCRRLQLTAAHDVGDLLQGIVDDDRRDGSSTACPCGRSPHLPSARDRRRFRLASHPVARTGRRVATCRSADSVAMPSPCRCAEPPVRRAADARGQRARRSLRGTARGRVAVHPDRWRSVSTRPPPPRSRPARQSRDRAGRDRSNWRSPCGSRRSAAIAARTGCSQRIPSQWRMSNIAATKCGRLRTVSISSMRSSMRPPQASANCWLSRAE